MRFPLPPLTVSCTLVLVATVWSTAAASSGRLGGQRPASSLRAEASCLLHAHAVPASLTAQHDGPTRGSHECGPLEAARPDALEAEVTEWLRRAVRTQATTRSRLSVLGDAHRCDIARLVSYIRSDAEPGITDQWYLASQLWADAALFGVISLLHDRADRSVSDAAVGPPVLSDANGPEGGGPAVWDEPSLGWDEAEALCHLEKGLILLDRLWDVETAGYYARSDATGTAVQRGPRFVDDNSLAGLALLEAAATAFSAASGQRYLHAARRTADFLIGSKLWDETFGGGFWWNTGLGDTPEGKPAQTNALAALFFARLYTATGVEAYRDWAVQTLLWMDTILYDPARELYRWSVSYQEPARGEGAVLSDRFFNYDQAIAIEAQIVAAELDGNSGRLDRARALGEAMHAAFWAPERGGYNLEAGVEQVYASYGAWASFGHLALFDLDQHAGWLERARANAEAIGAALGEPDGGYAYRHYVCEDRIAPGCESGLVASVVDRTRDTAAQAWMQHLQSAITRRLVQRDAGDQAFLVAAKD